MVVNKKYSKNSIFFMLYILRKYQNMHLKESTSVNKMEITSKEGQRVSLH